MIIDFLKTSDNPIKLEKSYQTVKSVSGNLNESCSVINPVITVSYDAGLLSANYAHIAAFNRFYYINDMTLDGKNIIISMHSDVLMNAKEAVKNAEATIVRSNVVNDMLPDSKVIQTSEHMMQFKELGRVAIEAEGCYILNIGGYSHE